jgi:hypothetical protein
MDADYYRQESAFPNVTWVRRPFRLSELLNAVRSNVPVPSKRVLETLLRESVRSVNGVLFDGKATTQDPAEWEVLITSKTNAPSNVRGAYSRQELLGKQ